MKSRPSDTENLARTLRRNSVNFLPVPTASRVSAVAIPATTYYHRSGYLNVLVAGSGEMYH